MRISPLSAALFLLAAATFTQAEENTTDNYFGAKHIIAVGAAYQKADAEISASTPRLPGASLDLNDLGMDDTYTSWALEYRWRFASRWMLVAMAYTFDEDGSRTAQRDFNFDGQAFEAGVALDTALSIDTYILDVLYQVYSDDRTEIMVGGGLHAFDLESSIRGRVFVGDLEQEASSGGSTLLAPLPNLRAHASYRLGENWDASIAVGWLSAKVDDFDGSFTYIHPRLAYVFNDHWAATLGYQYVDIDLTQEKSSDREITLDATFTGPTLLIDYRF